MEKNAEIATALLLMELVDALYGIGAFCKTGGKRGSMKLMTLENNIKQISIEEAIKLYKNPEHEKRTLLIELNENKRRIQRSESMLCLRLSCDKIPILTICNELLYKIWNCKPSPQLNYGSINDYDFKFYLMPKERVNEADN